MKQINKTPHIKAKLTERGLDPDMVTVFEATMVNTRPLRKKHPLYKGSVLKRNVLTAMAASLEEETVPVQIMHDSQPLSIGRVFDSKVLDLGNESEIRGLFAIANHHKSEIASIESGAVDQVSVNLLPRAIFNSKSGFDYLGADSGPDNVWTGTDNDGNTIGENGVYGILDGLSEWNELSLVSKGGAQNARILNRSSSVFNTEQAQRLAATGVDPNFLMLNATQETITMADANLEAAYDKVSDLKVELSNTKREKSELETQLEASQKEVETLTAQLAKAEKKNNPKADEVNEQAELLASKDEEIAAQKADVTALQAALTEVARKILVASGDVQAKVPTDVNGLVATVTEAQDKLGKVLVLDGKANDAIADAKKTSSAPKANAFKSSR